ncbi:MAG: dimethylamine corrinoid protein 3 [Dethiobacter sp.]|nr:MAG: dimethylamine corrinoid protein 3 [Dethiobacter sp.]
MSKEILAKLQRAVEEQDVEAAEAAAREAVAAGIDPFVAINEGLSPAMQTISDLFDDGELYVPQILFAAEAFMNAMAILTEKLSAEEVSKTKRGKVIVHTVQGDIHDIGKNIVGTMLTANGFEVIDLGRDVPIDVVVEKAKELGVDMVTGSALMTTTMPSQRDIVKALDEEGIRGKVKCMFGGAPVTKEWVDQIGADGYASNASEAVIVAKELMG